MDKIIGKSNKIACLLWKRTGKYLRLDSNIELESLNNTYLNIVKIFNKLFQKMNIIEMLNLVATSTRKKGNFKFTGKIKPVTGKS